MITNERQFRITKALLSKLTRAVEAFDIDEATERIGSKILAMAELEALKGEEEVLSEQLGEYEALKSGAVTVLKAESLEELPTLLIRARIAKGLNQRQLAEKLGLKEQQIQRYESGEYASANLRRLAEVAKALGLSITKVAELDPPRVPQASEGKQDIEWDRFPLKEMYRRNWFERFTGSMAQAKACQRELIEEFVHSAISRRQPAFLKHQPRCGTKMDQYALRAWQCRVLMLAKKATLEKRYSRDLLTDEWLRALAQESRFDDGPLRAKKRLAQIGIPLVVEPHLPQTYLDGAAFLLPNGDPVIGLSLRYDRLDNFWFVLFHELIHVMKHLQKGKLMDIFDDLDAEPDNLEREANALAGEVLIPGNIWEVALARYMRTEESIRSLAEDLRIHPSIIAGRIRNEAENYLILGDLVGSAEVRRQFPGVQFAW